ncbi:hypothetical protein [Chitinophaga niabensis]|uniref:Uncharacterized protein n=1 Tax=Chitinophaga niabensis TaxID=536979 RepID=A0A1N6D0W9_9BACT|nr:hypothetical protein [Chitinophaga niabensis]SIN64387.1 hypothetical protein SAMN04488055_0054 [Chitinophaga niabensis]
MNRFLDLRFVIGLFFLLTGTILLLHKVFHPEQPDVNLWCGGLFVLFGLLMTMLSKNEKE